MRIIGGEYRRRRLVPLPKGAETRPVPDLVREAFFNLLRGHIEGEGFLDVFAGTGSMGLEAVSRGASRVVCVERDRRVAKVLEENIELLGCGDRIEIAIGDALGPAALSRAPRPVHVVFVDPPYPLTRDPEGWDRIRRQMSRFVGLLDETGYAAVRTPWPFIFKEPIEGDPEDPNAPRSRTIDPEMGIEGAIGPETHAYGTTALHLYMRDPDARGG
jgi:16S rRNA (guanine966-N2)-methyltransferase